LDLTQREQDVLNLLAEGHPNGQIGDRLHLSPRTIEKYVSSLLSKTGTTNRAELVRFAIDHHLVQ
jgi:DNA-binding NarL/FixJ family response regulator